MNETIKSRSLAIRDTARRMFDTNMVQRLAYERDFYELVVFIEEHRKEAMCISSSTERHKVQFKRIFV